MTMLRIVCRQDNAAMAANVGGPVQTTYKTFDVSAPELIAWLSGVAPYLERVVIGAELITAAAEEPKEGR